MQGTENRADLLESLLEKAREYGNTSIELLKLKAIDKTADITSSFILYLILFCVLFVFLLFANIGIALWLGDVLGRSWYGFISVGSFYGIVGISLFFLVRKRFRRILGNLVIHQLLK